MSLRSMERELACQRQQVIIEPIAEAFCEAWEITAAGETFDPRVQADPYQPLPELTVRVAQTTLADIDLLRAVAEAGALVLATGPIMAYLAQCRRDHSTPDPRRVVLAIVHGFGETRVKKPGKTCRCLAKVVLVPLINND